MTVLHSSFSHIYYTQFCAEIHTLFIVSFCVGYCPDIGCYGVFIEAIGCVLLKNESGYYG